MPTGLVALLDDATNNFVIASVAKQSRACSPLWIAASPMAPRNDGEGGIWVKHPAVYIMANRRNGAVYTGVTSALPQRVWQHREGVVEGFTKRHGCKMLVWFEMHATMDAAITREKQIKGGSRKKKLALIEALNPRWRDLFEDIAHG